MSHDSGVRAFAGVDQERSTARTEAPRDAMVCVGFVVWHSTSGYVFGGRVYPLEEDAQKVANAAVWHTRSALVVKPVWFV